MRISDWSSDVCSSDLTLVVIDGIPVLMYNYHLIPSIPPSEVKSVEIIKFAKNFSRLYMEAVPNANPMEIPATRSEEHTSELQSLMRISYAVFCLKKKKTKKHIKKKRIQKQKTHTT